MTPEQWRRVSEWLNAWLAADSVERERLRERFVGDHPELASDLDALTKASAVLPTFLEIPAFTLALHDLVEDEGTLAAGTTIGPYAIARLLARGGTGDVYRATDVRLGRDVAIKLLALTPGGDPHAHERFIQEGRIAASLDHPNVVRVFDVGVFDDRPYIVTELLEGETLRGRIARGPLTVPDALDIARQAANGLAAAHATGLVHRDLKPENIFLTRSGSAKILDFGIAKVEPEDARKAGFTTMTHLVVGTAAYLSPEQILNVPVDARADLFAFGIVLFEMLTAKQPFAGGHTVDLLHAIVHQPAPTVLAERHDTPPALAAIVAHLLPKAPEQRFQSAADLACALERVHHRPLAEPASIASHALIAQTETGDPSALARPAPFTRIRWRTLHWWTLGAIGAVLAIAIWARPAGSPPPQLTALSVVFEASERFWEWGPDFALSPDGSTLVYTPITTGVAQLHVRRIDELEGRLLHGTDGAWGPFFSPDGRWVGFNQRGTLKKIALDGGAPVPLSGTAVRFIGAADWSTDSHIVYANVTPEGTHGLYRLPAGGGAAELIAALDERAEDAYWLTPQSIAGGQVILCTVAGAERGRSSFQLVAVSVATGERRVLLNDAKHGLYVGDEVLVYWRNGSLFATRFDPRTLVLSGLHVPAWSNVSPRVRLRSWAYAAGTLVYWPNLLATHRLVWVDRNGRREPLATTPAQYHAPRVAPDGRSVAFIIGGEFGDVWKHDLASGATVQLTFDGRSGSLLWTPDSSRLIVPQVRASGGELVAIRADGAGQPDSLPHIPPAPGGYRQALSWADGGRALLLYQPGVESLWIAWLDGSREPQALPSSRLTKGHLSPDGRWLAFSSLTSDLPELYVTPFPRGSPRWKLPEGGGVPMWSRSGRELFYRSGDRMMVVDVSTTSGFVPSEPRVLFEGRYYEAEPGGPNFDITPDDSRFLMVLPGDSGPDRLNLIQGWKAEIERRLRGSH